MPITESSELTKRRRAHLESVGDVVVAAEVCNTMFAKNRVDMGTLLVGHNIATATMAATFLANVLIRASSQVFTDKMRIPLPQAFELMVDMTLEPNAGVWLQQFDQEGNEL